MADPYAQLTIKRKPELVEHHRKFEEWKASMIKKGYNVVGETAFSRQDDSESASGYREIPVQRFGKRTHQLAISTTGLRDFSSNYTEQETALTEAASKEKTLTRKLGSDNKIIVNEEPSDKNVSEIGKNNARVIEETSQTQINKKEKAPLPFEQELANRLKGVGQRAFGDRDRATQKLLTERNLPSDLDSDTLRDIRIGHAWVTKSGAIRTNPSRGPSLLIKKKKKKEDE